MSANVFPRHDGGAADDARFADGNALRLVSEFLPLFSEQLFVEQQLVQLAVEEGQVLAHVFHLLVLVVTHVAPRPAVDIKNSLSSLTWLIVVVPCQPFNVSILLRWFPKERPTSEGFLPYLQSSRTSFLCNLRMGSIS
jgi:hypothetical protein